MSDYVAITDEQGIEVMRLLAEEGATLRRACRHAGCSKTTFLRWKDASKELMDRYAKARAAQIEHWADETLDISDDNARDVYTTEDGKEIVDYDVLGRAKLRVDTRKWLLSKLARKTYGDTTQHEHTGNVNVVVQSFARLAEPKVIEGEVVEDE